METRGNQDAWIEGGFKVPIVEGDSETVETEGTEEACVGCCKKLMQELFEKVILIKVLKRKYGQV